MKRLYESILDTNIVDKTNKNASEILKYHKNLKKMYDIFWDEFQVKILDKYNIDDADIREKQYRTIKGIRIPKKTAIFKLFTPAMKKEDIIADIVNIFKMSYYKAFGKNPDSKTMVTDRNNGVDFVNNEVLSDVIDTVRWGGLTYNRISSNLSSITVSMKYVER